MTARSALFKQSEAQRRIDMDWPVAVPRGILTSWVISATFATYAEASQETNERPQDEPVASIELRTAVGPETVFGEIGAIVGDESGRMYVADVMANEIAVLDPDGTRVATIGRPGEGPGEFQGLSPTLAWSGEFLVTFDWRKRAFAYFSRAGEFAGNAAWSGGVPVWGSMLFSGGTSTYARVMVRSAQPLSAIPMNPGGGVIAMPAPDVVYAAFDSARVVHPLGMIPDSIPWPQSVDCTTDRSRIDILPKPFADWSPQVAFTSAGEVAVASRGSYKVSFYDSSTGSITRELSHPVPRVPVSDEAWEANPNVQWLRTVEEEAGRPLSLATDPSLPCPIDEDRPRFHPAIRGLVIDEEDRLWVDSPGRESFELRIFNPDGELIGTAAMPERDERVPFFVRNSLLYLVTRDALDVQSVRVHEVTVPD